MKGTAIILICAFALALCDDEEIQLNANGCPVDFTIYKVKVHETYCNLFYSCDRGDKVELRCPANLVFNAEEEVCDWPLNVDCGGRGISEYVPESEEDKEEVSPGGNNDPSAAAEICAKPGSDNVLVANENCNQFYKCDRGRPVAVECPDNLHYNSELGYCDWPFNVDCGDRIVPNAAKVKTNRLGIRI